MTMYYFCIDDCYTSNNWLSPIIQITLSHFTFSYNFCLCTLILIPSYDEFTWIIAFKCVSLCYILVTILHFFVLFCICISTRLMKGCYDSTTHLQTNIWSTSKLITFIWVSSYIQFFWSISSSNSSFMESYSNLNHVLHYQNQIV